MGSRVCMKGQAVPAWHWPCLKNLHGTCFVSGAHGQHWTLLSALRGAYSCWIFGSADSFPYRTVAGLPSESHFSHESRYSLVESALNCTTAAICVAHCVARPGWAEPPSSYSSLTCTVRPHFGCAQPVEVLLERSKDCTACGDYKG